jgi:hypothetical protein
VVVVGLELLVVGGERRVVEDMRWMVGGLGSDIWGLGGLLT